MFLNQTNMISIAFRMTTSLKDIFTDPQSHGDDDDDEATVVNVGTDEAHSTD